MLREVAQGIFQIGLTKRSFLAPFSVNVFVIAGKDGLVFDGGLGGNKAGEYLVRKIREIESIMTDRGEECRITRIMPSHGHWDHFSGVAYAKKHLGLTVLSTPEMFSVMRSKESYRKSFRKDQDIIHVPAPFFQRQIINALNRIGDDLFFKLYKITGYSGPFETVHDGQVLGIGGEPWEIRFVPGHCADDLVLFNRKRGILFCGDIILRSINTWIGPPRSDLSLYMKSLETLQAIPGLTLILPSHGSPITEPYKRLKDAADHRRKRTLELIAIIRKHGDKGITFKDIFKIIYPTASLRERYIARGWILLTLKYLVDKGLVHTTVKGRDKVFVHSWNLGKNVQNP